LVGKHLSKVCRQPLLQQQQRNKIHQGKNWKKNSDSGQNSPSTTLQQKQECILFIKTVSKKYQQVYCKMRHDV